MTFGQYIVLSPILQSSREFDKFFTFNPVDKSVTLVYNIMYTYGGVKVSTGSLKCDKRAEYGVSSITVATFKYKRKK